jgi:hypothetical protein
MSEESLAMENDEKVTLALTRIMVGGAHMVAITRRCIAEALDEIDAGDFPEALVRLQKACGAIGTVAHASDQLGIASNAEAVKATDLIVGMTLPDVGEISEVERCGDHIHVHVDAQVLVLDSRAEVFIVSENEAA